MGIKTLLLNIYTNTPFINLLEIKIKYKMQILIDKKFNFVLYLKLWENKKRLQIEKLILFHFITMLFEYKKF